MGQQMAKNFGIGYLEVSAKLGQVDQIINCFAERFYTKTCFRSGTGFEMNSVFKL